MSGTVTTLSELRARQLCRDLGDLMQKNDWDWAYLSDRYQPLRECVAKALAAERLEEAECMFTNWNVHESIRSFTKWYEHHVAELRALAGSSGKQSEVGNDS